MFVVCSAAPSGLSFAAGKPTASMSFLSFCSSSSIFAIESRCICSSFSSVTDFSGINFGLQKTGLRASSLNRTPLCAPSTSFSVDAMQKYVAFADCLVLLKITITNRMQLKFDSSFLLLFRFASFISFRFPVFVSSFLSYIQFQHANQCPVL
ncbi:hypothetical protein Tcan_01506, partial [Toxocara canis]